MPDTLTTSTLESLRERVRNATGADRDLDLDILKGLGKAPADAVWEKPRDDVLSSIFPKRSWERPEYRAKMDAYNREVTARISSRENPDDTIKLMREHEPHWDFKNDPQSGSVPHFTSSIDACVRLIGEVLPGWWWTCGTCCTHADGLRAEIGPIEHASPYDESFDIDRRQPANVPLALLEALLTALIEIEKIKQPT